MRNATLRNSLHQTVHPWLGLRLKCEHLLLCAMLAPGAAQTIQAGWAQNEQAIMGTAVVAEVWHDDEVLANEGVAAVMREMRRIDALMSTYKVDSELSRLNRNAADYPVTVSRELLALIAQALEFSTLTDGAFDITYASAGRLYDYRAAQRPSTAELNEALPKIDYRHVLVDDAASTIKFARQGVTIDLGGIAKGHAVDSAIDLLRGMGIRHALVTAGGDTGLLGDRRARPWVVGVRDPRRPDQMVAKLSLQDEAISTSGDYERYFEEDGVRYHHILNPGTGKSAGEVRSVTIIGPDATTTDALSTSVFVLGIEAGLRLVDSVDAIDCVIVDNEGRLHYSSGLARPQ